MTHVLRRDNKTPAYQVLLFATVGCQTLKGRVGRHRTDLFKRQMYLKNEDDFANLAKDRLGWRNLFTLRHIKRRSLRKRK